MNKILLTVIFVLVVNVTYSQTYVSPVGFVENEVNKQRVIRFIKTQVKADMQALGMDTPQVLRMMEGEQLASFKKLLKATDLPLLKRMENDMCRLNMCNYQTIWMMYEENYKASKNSLEW